MGCGRAPRSRKRAERIPAGIRHGGNPKRRVEVWGGGGSWRAQGPGSHRDSESDKHTHYFLPLHPPILVPRLHLQLAQAQGFSEIYSGKSRGHLQQGKQTPPTPAGLRLAPQLPVGCGEVLLLLKAFL